MTLEQAIKTAIEFETRVRDVYSEAAASATNEIGSRVFTALGKEEQGHIEYLQSKLDDWTKTGKVTSTRLDTIVPSQDVIDRGVEKLDTQMARTDHGMELAMLTKALQVEGETADFYRRMVDELGPEGELFARFLEIEQGHQTIVQAEIDYLSRTGFCFDFQEFNMEH
jgi:rubrerythrin